LLKMVLLEIHRGRESPAQWFQDIPETDCLKWLGQGVQPSRSQLYRFRDRLKDEWLQNWNGNLVQAAVVEQLTSGMHGSLDGTTVAACASRHQLMTSARLEKRSEQLREAVARDLAGEGGSLSAVHQPAPSPQWMAKTPAGRGEQWDRYQHAQRILQQRNEENAKRPKDKRQKPEKIVVSVSDPEAPVGKDKFKVFRPLYNVQCLCDRETDLILAYDTFTQTTDAGTLPQMLPRVRDLLGSGLKTVAADSAYASLNDLLYCHAAGALLFANYQSNSFTAAKLAAKTRLYSKVDFKWSEEKQTLICPQGNFLERETKSKRTRVRGPGVMVTQYRCPPQYCVSCPVQQLCTKCPEKGRTIKRLDGEEFIEQHRARMDAPEAKAIIRQRPATIERRFADAKTHRAWTRFHGRGHIRAKTETGLVVLTHNLITLETIRKKRALPP
jgi:hypothetical protein